MRTHGLHPSGCSVRGILQARILEWAATLASRESFQPRDQTQTPHVSCTGRRVLYHECRLGSPPRGDCPSEGTHTEAGEGVEMSRGGLGLGQNLTQGAQGHLWAELHGEKGTQALLEPQPRALSVHMESCQPTATGLQLQGHLGLPAHPAARAPPLRRPREPEAVAPAAITGTSPHAHLSCFRFSSHPLPPALSLPPPPSAQHSRRHFVFCQREEVKVNPNQKEVSFNRIFQNQVYWAVIYRHHDLLSKPEAVAPESGRTFATVWPSAPSQSGQHTSPRLSVTSCAP